MFKKLEPTRPSPLFSRNLAIALVVSFAFLFIAIGFVVWIFIQRSNVIANNISSAPPADDTSNVKNVVLNSPANLPANYVLNNQSTGSVTRMYYYDDATNCGITVTVVNKDANKTVKDVIVDTITAAQAQGVTTMASYEGNKIDLADSEDSSKKYAFDSVELDQQVNVPSVTFTQQNNIILYRQFGRKVASLAYACKSETWSSKKSELLEQIKQFTVKTEK